MAKSEFEKRFPTRDSGAARALAASVRQLRKERGWTQDDLAAEVGIEQGALSLIENARANPSLLVIETIAKKLDVEIGELFAQKTRAKRAKDR